MDELVLGIIIISKSGPSDAVPSCVSANYSAQRKQGTFAERDGDVVAGDENILSRYFKFLLNDFKYEENKSICFYVRGLIYLSLFC